MNTFYEAEAFLKSEGRGLAHLHSNDGSLDLVVSDPKKSGQVPNATNPEQLFAAAYASCFENALLFAARHLRLNVTQAEIHGKVAIGTDKNGVFKIAVRLRAQIPELDRKDALELIDEATRVWPYAQAKNADIDIQIDLDDRLQ